jgi:phosphoglycolate phosphatase
MRYRAIIFDLDGTLIDQFKAIHQAFSKTIEDMGFNAPTYHEVRRAVGGASEATMALLIGTERAKEAVVRLRPNFEKVMLDGVTPLPFAMESLARLNGAGLKTAVLTNKYGPHARATCEHLGFSDYLEFTLGADDTKWKKPQPELTDHVLAKLGVSASETVYIGDSPYDFKTAKNAGLECILVPTGTHSAKELSSLGSTIVLQDLNEVTNQLLASNAQDT